MYVWMSNILVFFCNNKILSTDCMFSIWIWEFNSNLLRVKIEDKELFTASWNSATMKSSISYVRTHLLHSQNVFMWKTGLLTLEHQKPLKVPFLVFPWCFNHVSRSLLLLWKRLKAPETTREYVFFLLSSVRLQDYDLNIHTIESRDQRFSWVSWE